MIKKRKLINIFKFAEVYLKEILPSGINLEKYLTVEKNLTSINYIACSLFISLQNRQQMPNIIKFDDNKKVFDKLFFNYNPKRILNTYNEESLFEIFKQKFRVRNSESSGNLWRQYAKSIISASNFLVNFRNIKEFDDFIINFSTDQFTRAALPTLLAKEIHGFGFALSCEFLKELGYLEYPKPDIHLIDIFSALELCSNNQYEVYKTIIVMAQACRKTPYYVDKVFWLICSGNYYLDNLQVKGYKREFISESRAKS